MPQAIAAAIIAEAGILAGTAAAYGVTAGVYAAFLVGGSVVARRQQRRQLREYNNSLQDRRFTVRGAAEPKNIVFGRTRVGGVQLAPGWTHGNDNREWSVPIAFTGHEIDAFEAVWLGDEDAQFAGTWTGVYQTVVPTSKWAKRSESSATMQVIGGGAAGATVTIPGGANAIRVDSIAYPEAETPSPDSLPVIRSVTLKENVDYSVARVSNDLKVTWITAQTSRDLVITYTTQSASTYAWARFFLGGPNGERDTDLETWSQNDWKSTDVGKGIARAHFRFTFDESIYPTGAPAQVSVILRGAKVYDPRLDSTNGGSGSHRIGDSSTWAWSANPALCWLYYMLSPLGANVPATRIDWPSVVAAANVCDETISLSGGGTQKRYECHGVLSTSADIRANIDAILSSMAGIRYYSGGKWYVKAGAYVTPTVDLTEDDFADGEIRIMPRTKRRELFNSIRGKFVDARPAGTLSASDAGGLYALTDFPSYSSATYMAQDGGAQLWSDIELPLTTDWRMAQRIALLMLNRHRQALTIACTMKVGRTYRLQPGDTFRLTSPTNGWTNKVFRVVDRSYAPHGNVGLVAQEEAPEVYSWGPGDEVAPDPAPNTLLPDPRVIAPLKNFNVSTGSVYELPDGTRVPYAEATWDAITDSAVLAGGRIEIYWKRSIDQLYRKLEARPTDTSARIEPVSGGDTLNVYAVVVNASQARSLAVFATVGLDSSLPAGTVVPALSANLLRNAALDVNAAGWTPGGGGGVASNAVEFRRYTDAPNSLIPGSPSSLCLLTTNATTGNTPYGFVSSWPFSIDPDKTYCAYADLFSYATDAYVQLEFFTSAYVLISYFKGNVVAQNNVSSQGNWNDPAKYARSSVTAVAPSNARLGRITVVSLGNWTNAPIKATNVYRPFAGVLPDGAADLPPWDAGGANPVGTELIAPGAATYVGRRATIAGPIGLGASAVLADIVMYDDLRGFDLAVTATFDYHAENTQNLDGLIASTAWLVLKDGTGAEYAGTTRTLLDDRKFAPSSNSWRAVEITQRWTVTSAMTAPYTIQFKGREKYAIVVGGGTPNVSADVSNIDLSVEVIKR